MFREGSRFPRQFHRASRNLEAVNRDGLLAYGLVGTCEVPAVLPAENDYAVQGFRTGDVFGVQFHPEYDRETAERITRGKDLPETRIQCVLEGITEENVAEASKAKVVFDNFLEYVTSGE